MIGNHGLCASSAPRAYIAIPLARDPASKANMADQLIDAQKVEIRSASYPTEYAKFGRVQPRPRLG